MLILFFDIYLLHKSIEMPIFVTKNINRKIYAQ